MHGTPTPLARPTHRLAGERGVEADGTVVGPALQLRPVQVVLVAAPAAEEEHRESGRGGKIAGGVGELPLLHGG